MDIDQNARVQAESDIEIPAPTSQVWRVLTDLAHWPEWNTDVTRMEIDNSITPGTTFTWKSGGLTIVSTIEEVVAHERIVWSGKTLGTRAVHVYEFEPTGDTEVRVRTRESFSGWLPTIFPSFMRKTLERSLTSGLMQLKAASENVK